MEEEQKAAAKENYSEYTYKYDYEGQELYYEGLLTGVVMRHDPDLPPVVRFDPDLESVVDVESLDQVRVKSESERKGVSDIDNEESLRGVEALAALIDWHA